MEMSEYERAKYKDKVSLEEIENPVGSKKWDGSHFVLFIQPNGSTKWISRRESVKGGYPDRTEKLPHLSDIKLPQYAGNVYSLELIHTGHNTGPDSIESHPAVSGILNSLAPKAIETQKVTGPIRAVLLDVKRPTLNTYGEKIEHLKEIERAFGNSSLLFAPDIKIGLDEISKLIKSTKERGEEGVIVTSLTTPESDNYRVKIKFINTYNLRVGNILQEFDISGKPKESMGAMELIDGSGKMVGKVGTGFSREQRIEIWKNKDAWSGKKLVQVKAMDPTAHKLRSARYNGVADGNIDTL